MEDGFLNSHDSLTNQRMTITKIKVCLRFGGATYNQFLSLCYGVTGCFSRFFLCSLIGL